MAPQEQRPHAVDIYERIVDDSEEELGRTPGSLACSGLFAGVAIGLAPLALALATVSLGDAKSTALIAALFYPVGYVAVILGRSQFFTENTLYPVMLTLRRPQFLGATARLWGIVLATNLAGAFLFALLAGTSDALSQDVQDKLVSLGAGYVDAGFTEVFFGAVVTGFVLALVAWLVESVDGAAARVMVIWALTTLIALGSFDHCVASTAAAFVALLDGTIDLGSLAGWFAPALLGNVVGGVLIVTSINYGQVRHDD